jgi:hypothetical protein
MKQKFNFYLGIAASAWLLAAMVIATELIAAFKTLLVPIFVHHWISKAVVVSLAFVAAGFLHPKNSENAKLGWYSVLGSMAVILLFYIIEFLK